VVGFGTLGQKRTRRPRWQSRTRSYSESKFPLLPPIADELHAFVEMELRALEAAGSLH